MTAAREARVPDEEGNVGCGRCWAMSVITMGRVVVCRWCAAGEAVPKPRRRLNANAGIAVRNAAARLREGVTVAKRTVTRTGVCGVCGKPGHNKRTCRRRGR